MAANVVAMPRAAVTPPTERKGLSVYNIVLNYGLADWFFLGSALHYLLQAACAADPRPDLRAARSMVEVEIAREDAGDPIANEIALEWATPAAIAAAYATTGAHRDAVILLLEYCALDLDDEPDEHGIVCTPLDRLSDLIAHAIDDLTPAGGAA